jgi:hypothetical protein
MERCANCERPIGKLETPHIWQERIVCGQCIAILKRTTLEYATPVPPEPVYSPPVMEQSSSVARQIRAEYDRARRERRSRQSGAQVIAILIMLLGGALICVFWPLGVVVILTGLIVLAVNTPLW